jgi:hypothetical protein
LNRGRDVSQKGNPELSLTGGKRALAFFEEKSRRWHFSEEESGRWHFFRREKPALAFF